MTWKLEKLLSNLPYDDLDISEEVKEQVELGIHVIFSSVAFKVLFTCKIIDESSTLSF